MIKLERILQLFIHRIMLFATIALWTLAISGSLIWNIYHSKKTTVELATNEAVVHLTKDMAFGRWGAKYGGVYLPVSDDIKPSPFLAHLPDRDVVTTSGEKLTLTNPAYMLKSFLDDNGMVPRDYSSITSLNPLNPENEPDFWQESALRAFESGAPDAFTIESYKGKTCIRYMRPVLTEKSCLKCHESQGYKEGDIRGGISISVPLINYQGIANKEIQHFNLTHGFIWLFGIVGIFRGWAGIRQHNEEKQKAFNALEKSEKQTRYLNSALLNAHETERKRIAIEVHDEIGQIVIATKFIIENAIEKVKRNAFKELDRHLDKAVTILQKVIQRVRNLEKNLLPPLLKDLGLLAATSSFCRDFENDYVDIKVRVKIDAKEEDIPSHLKITVFRIIQESFSNIARHSAADLALLEIRKSENSLKLSITDNGRGFYPDTVYEGHPSEMGLACLKERTEFSGGVFVIRSGPGLGTNITCTWPC